MPQKTPEGKVLLWDRAGKQHEHWPIDARGMLAQKAEDGEPVYTTEPPEGVTPLLPPAPPRAVTIPRGRPAQVFDGAAEAPAAAPAKRKATKGSPAEPPVQDQG